MPAKVGYEELATVETIGDAYMIVSGVPSENGNNHVQHIADIALKMRAFVSNFKLQHRPDEVMMVRIGFHSGSVAAGVVGLAAPRCCSIIGIFFDILLPDRQLSDRQEYLTAKHPDWEI
ncbi:hypothetical protein COOONC_01049 [Cooperia oncophora]